MSTSDPTNPTPGELRPGARVEVRNRFDGSWAPGFEIAEPMAGDGWHVRRLSDGRVLPSSFPREELRHESTRRPWRP